MIKYNFPEIKKGDHDGVLNQIYKIKEEVFEFQNSKGYERDLEALDILHAVETFLRWHFEGREDEVDELTKEVIDKNAVRGYYPEI